MCIKLVIVEVYIKMNGQQNIKNVNRKLLNKNEKTTYKKAISGKYVR